MTSINPNLPVHNVRDFTWTNGHGVAEQSDFNGKNLVGLLYMDAVDMGFNVRGNTGILTFVLDTVDQDGTMHFSNLPTGSHGAGVFTITLPND